MMTRLIDTMTEEELSHTVIQFYSSSLRDLRHGLEILFAKEPHWSDGLDPDDDQTWVLCFVSDDAPDCTFRTAWINQFEKGIFWGLGRYDLVTWAYVTPVDLTVRFNKGGKYATPVDLNLRYNYGED